jgi:hypothetical protein
MRRGTVVSIGGRVKRMGFGLLALIGVAVYLGYLPVASLASSAPIIESESVSHVTEHGATLEAQINPDGIETTYSFWVEYEVCRRPLSIYEEECHPVLLGPLEEGHLFAEGQAQTVSSSLTGLEANHAYDYWVLATDSAGPASGMVNRFWTSPMGGSLETEGKPLPIPESTLTPYESKLESGIEGGAAAAAAQQLLLAKQEEQERAERQWLESPPYKEVQERIEEQERKEAQAREARSSSKKSFAAPCIVPLLRGDSLAAARSALKSAHCALGTVTKPHRHHGALNVIRQNRAHGTKLRHEATVAVYLGARHAS